MNNVIKDFKCIHCDSTFTSKICLQHHIKDLHMSIENYKCNICHKEFANSSELVKHKECDHSSDWSNVKGIFECNQCKKIFDFQKNLDQHVIAIHEGLKEFKSSQFFCTNT